jgi:hypothetical protein
MTMHVIGAGVGRTGTLSLRLAINRLGLGPTYHMQDVLHNQPERVPQWSEALKGRPDWSTIFQGFKSAVDWPTAAFFRELSEEYPSAKFVLTHRSPESWAASFGDTIYKALAGKDEAPPEAQDWLDMCTEVIAHTGFPAGLDDKELMKAFVAHNEAVKSTIPANRLLVFEVKEGWEPLCQFLGTEVPDEPFPRTNNREEFWELVSGNT